MFQLTLPVSQEEIPGVVKQIRAELARLDAERRVVAAMFQAIQSLCIHPKTYNSHHYDGSCDIHCEVCGRTI